MASAKTGLDRLLGRAVRVWSSVGGGRRKGRAADRTRVLASGLFDADVYRAAYPDVARAGLDPLDHYLGHGGLEGRAAGPAFHGAAYLVLNPDVARAGLNPLLHYLDHGRAEGRPVPTGEALDRLGFSSLDGEEIGLVVRVAASPLFDAAWYADRHPDVAASGVAPAVHYVRRRGNGVRHPGPLFDARRYAADNPDVAAGGGDPFLHYLTHGAAEGRAHHPVDPLEAETTPEDDLTALVAASGLFDAAWYTNAYPDVGRSGLPPIAHFVRHGLPRGYDPGPGFDVAHYGALYPDVEAAGLHPLVHYVQHGRAEGRAPLPTPTPPPAVEATPRTWLGRVGLSEDQAAALVRSSPLFNADWYMTRHLDVARSDLQPDLHYVRHGGPEGRPPSLQFDPAFYRAQVPEAAEADVDPLIHFLLFGRATGARPHPLLDAPPRLSPLHRDAYPIVAPADPVEDADAVPPAAPPADGDLWLTLSGAPLVPAGDAAALRGNAAAALAFWRLSGGTGTAPLAVGGGDDPTPPDGALARAVTDLARLAVSDLWFADAGTLRIRRDGPAGGGGQALAVHQWDAEGGRPVAAHVTVRRDGGFQIVDAKLPAPLHPVLLVGTDMAGQPVAVLLPFPSLCRGGLHHVELVAGALAASPIDEIARRSLRLATARLGAKPGDRWIGRLAVDRRAALLSEPLLSAEMGRWLRQVFDLVSDAAEAGADTSAGTLLLPPDCVPTLDALTAREGPMLRSDTAPLGSFLVAEAITNTPVASVAVPPLDAIWSALQPRRQTAGFPQRLPAGQCASGARPFPWAIRLRPAGRPMDASLLMPHAPDNPDPILVATPSEPVPFRIAVVIKATDPARLPALLDSLGDQANTEIAQVLVLVETPETADWAALVGGRIDAPLRIVGGTGEDWPDLAGLAALVTAPLTLFLDDTMVLHDRRTVSVLGTIARAEGVASAAAATVHERFSKHGSALSVETGGYFPSHVGLGGSPGLILSLPETAGALPDATYPVVANRFACCMVRTAVLGDLDLAAVGSPGSIPEPVRFALAALAAGHRHACTTVVRVGDRHPDGLSEVVDPIGLAALGPRGLDGLLGAVTLLKEVR
ncbi:hypothetical protein [Mongoliimonas terrestris]|uniref:hypothetical protein n=1 Tax=Mongoliimonas terrestris TaxID=1709001 RepID=UPI000949505F|nr:hypothetical protein [Mongoliimonas terrestris]